MPPGSLWSAPVALCYYLAMSQPVKLSDALVLDARLAAEVQERSIAGQVEFWARLGRSIDLLLTGRQMTALRRLDQEFREAQESRKYQGDQAEPLSKRLASVDTPAGRARVAAYLETRPFPHFKSRDGRPELLVRIDEDGTETIGRFVNRVFVAVEDGDSAATVKGKARGRAAKTGSVTDSGTRSGTGSGRAREQKKGRSNLIAVSANGLARTREKQGKA
jgi:hypothetical protein